MVAAFMGTGSGPASVNAANASVGVEDDLGGLRGGNRGGNAKREQEEHGSGAVKVARQFLNRLFGGGAGRGGAAGGGGGTVSAAATEGNVAAMAGTGATSGMPTCSDDGTIEMVFHQVSCHFPLGQGWVAD
jgi:hypothetical protein